MKKSILTLLAAAAGVCVSCGGARVAEKPRPQRLTATIIPSGFTDGHDSYNAISTASDGRIFYVLSSAKPDVAAQMYVYDPASGKSKLVGDLNQASGEANLNAIAQGKSHVSFAESGGKLYFATHLGFYSIVSGMETPGIPPKGMKPYPGGHFLSYDLTTGKFESLATAPNNEGIISFQMDTRRKRLFGLTWPTGRLIRYDLDARKLQVVGDVSGAGEAGRGSAFRTICRSITVDPGDGSLYFSTSDGKLHRYQPERDLLETVAGDDLRKDYFGLYDPASSGHMGYNWRQTFWYEPDKSIYGVHGNSGYLFRFRPADGTVEVLDRITSADSKRSGMFDQFSYGYLGFALGPDGRAIYYLTGGPIYESGRLVRGKDSSAKGESKGRENLHLVTWDIPTGTYTDHGPIFFANGQRPNYVNSIAVGKDGAVYALSRVSEDDHANTDLIRIPPVALIRK
jgi:sugar lactone lactonase YvrE